MTGKKAVAATLLAVVLGARVDAQCTYSRSSNTAIASRISAGVTFIFGMNLPTGCSATSTISTSGNLMCAVVTTAPGMYNCPAGVMTGCRALLGWVSPTSMLMGMHTCKFDCGACGSFTITDSDGLPVELMDFEIEAPVEPTGREP